MSACLLGSREAVAKTAYIDEIGGDQIGLMECVKSSANKLVELCKSGWNYASLLVSRKEEPERAPDGDVGFRFLKCGLGGILDRVASNSVSQSGKGTGVGDASVCIAAAESVFIKLRTVPAAEFTGACTYVGGLEPVHESHRRRLVTTFDPRSHVNLIAERCADSEWRWLEGAEVNGVSGKAKALGAVMVPQWCLTMGGVEA